MRDTQRIVAEWMRRTLRTREWTAEFWGRRAGVAPTTITRAMQESYRGVTSLRALDKLARAADIDSPLDVLQPNCILVALPDDNGVLVPELIKVAREAVLRRVAQSLGGDSDS